MDAIALDIICHLCGSEDSDKLLAVVEKPAGETDYKIPPVNYYREVHECKNCGVFFNARQPDLIPENFYEGQYNAAIEMGTLDRRFHRIINLPYSKSDNKSRVLRIINHLYQNDRPIIGMDVLDVGSGTCVFLHEMNKFGFNTYSIDPDKSSAKHSKETVKVNKAYCGTLDSVKIDQTFDFISFNKVLEHVKNPIRVLSKAKDLLSESGIIYIEVPDGERIVKEDNILNRAEFFIDHHTTFNPQSFDYLIRSAGFVCNNIEQVLDPSGKRTILGFITIQKNILK